MAALLVVASSLAFGGGAAADPPVFSPVELDDVTPVGGGPRPAIAFHYNASTRSRMRMEYQSQGSCKTREAAEDIRAIPLLPELWADPVNRTRSFVTFGGREYTLDHIHFHAGAEHRFKSEAGSAAMEAHFVHIRPGDPNPVVVAVFLTPSRTLRLADDPYGRLVSYPAVLEPETGGDECRKLDGGDVREGVDLWRLLPPDLETAVTYRYTGSLTTPSGSPPSYHRPVHWVVFERPLPIGAEHSAVLRHIWSAFPNGNARPLVQGQKFTTYRTP
ncbi:carbonic anhydrase family protein [Rhizohabitans arisaemae]|uniref:carbonic anhydrase family protein n=1 Tax=Rhizohabitans arisaemae TaxID=2720610 RepID=UPI0024B0E24F|nr:carbonic anhydrase family protein [Rhizohabitans arisaemae]